MFLGPNNIFSLFLLLFPFFNNRPRYLFLTFYYLPLITMFMKSPTWVIANTITWWSCFHSPEWLLIWLSFGKLTHPWCCNPFPFSPISPFHDVPRSLPILTNHSIVIIFPSSQPFMPHSSFKKRKERSTTILFPLSFMEIILP